jgi:hypothetical protein
LTFVEEGITKFDTGKMMTMKIIVQCHNIITFTNLAFEHGLGSAISCHGNRPKQRA